MTVVDASVAVKWLFPEAHDAQAHKLLGGGERLIAPSIIRVEVIGAVIRRFREKKLSEDETRGACQVWEHILATGALTPLPFEEFFDAALVMALKAKHALPDCLYVAVAHVHRDRMVTADRTLFERGRRVYEEITMLHGHGSH